MGEMEVEFQEMFVAEPEPTLGANEGCQWGLLGGAGMGRSSAAWCRHLIPVDLPWRLRAARQPRPVVFRFQVNLMRRWGGKCCSVGPEFMQLDLWTFLGLIFLLALEALLSGGRL